MACEATVGHGRSEGPAVEVRQTRRRRPRYPHTLPRTRTRRAHRACTHTPSASTRRNHRCSLPPRLPESSALQRQEVGVGRLLVVGHLLHGGEGEQSPPSSPVPPPSSTLQLSPFRRATCSVVKENPRDSRSWRDPRAAYSTTSTCPPRPARSSLHSHQHLPSDAPATVGAFVCSIRICMCISA